MSRRVCIARRRIPRSPMLTPIIGGLVLTNVYALNGARLTSPPGLRVVI